MIKTHKITKEVEHDIMESCTCDWCGKEILLGHGGYIDGGTVKLYFGYGSDFDDDTYEAHICDDCFRKELQSKMILKRSG